MSVGACAGPTHAPLYCVRERARPAGVQPSKTASLDVDADAEAASAAGVAEDPTAASSIDRNAAFVEICMDLEVYYAKASANYIFASQIYTKGSDASNL